MRLLFNVNKDAARLSLSLSSKYTARMWALIEDAAEGREKVVNTNKMVVSNETFY